MSEGTDIFTTLGLTKIRNAAGTSGQVRIKYIAVGDALGLPYAPSTAQTALRREQLRVEIERHYPVGPNAWHVKASFPTDSAEVIVREMGFLDEDGDLIALWAGLDVGTSRRTGTIEYLINHVIAFDGVADGIMFIEAPLDDFVVQGWLTIANQARIIRHQFHFNEAFYAEHGRYPGGQV